MSTLANRIVQHQDKCISVEEWKEVQSAELHLRAILIFREQRRRLAEDLNHADHVAVRDFDCFGHTCRSAAERQVRGIVDVRRDVWHGFFGSGFINHDAFDRLNAAESEQVAISSNVIVTANAGFAQASHVSRADKGFLWFGQAEDMFDFGLKLVWICQCNANSNELTRQQGDGEIRWMNRDGGG